MGDMSDERDRIVNARLRLPDLTLPHAVGEATHHLRSRTRQARVLVLVHAAGCTPCGDYLRRLASVHDALRDWDGLVLVVSPSATTGVGMPDAALFPVLLDPESRLSRALSVQHPATVVADQWGEVHTLHQAGAEHRFPAPSELESTLRFLATRCPECEGEAF